MNSSYDPFRESREQLDELKRWAKHQRGQFLTVLAAILVAIAGFSSYYQIEPDEVGVVLRFGRHIEQTNPGTHFKLPFGIDQVFKVPVQRQLKMEFGFRTIHADVQSRFAHSQETKAESLMLTGDLNVGTVEWIVQYKVDDPVAYLFNFRDIDSTLRLMSEATMRTVVGDHSIDELLTSGRERVEDNARTLLEKLNKRYDTGINIQQLKLQDVNAPDPVKPALREVEEAKQERERAINEAWAEYNKVIPRASGRAEQAIEAAKGYAIQRTNEAQGDASRFSQLLREYKKAPEVTRTRLYLEAIDEVLPKAKTKYLVDAETKGLLPLLNLNSGSSQ